MIGDNYDIQYLTRTVLNSRVVFSGTFNEGEAMDDLVIVKDHRYIRECNFYLVKHKEYKSP